jgi:hypothetical protein
MEKKRFRPAFSAILGQKLALEAFREGWKFIAIALRAGSIEKFAVVSVAGG